MRLLLDTHTAVWLALTPQRLTAFERQMLDAGDSEVFVSAVSIWELRIKWNTLTNDGRRKGPAEPMIVLNTLIALSVTVLPLSALSSARSLMTPIGHRDPFDEQLLIEAQEHQLQLMTRDAQLLGHPLVLNNS